MKQLVELDRTKVPGGKEMVLSQRNGDFVVHVDGRELMGSRAHSSEEQLATLGCADLRSVLGARVLVGGLGMGYTLRAALRKLSDDAQVDVAELVASVTRWNRTFLAHLAGAPLLDPRVRVIERDVLDVINESERTYDAILLDVDNGPHALSAPSNARLYDPNGLSRSLRALRPGGVLAVWSTSDDRKFTNRLKQAGFATRIERPAARVGGSARHVLWIAKKASDPTSAKSK